MKTRSSASLPALLLYVLGFATVAHAAVITATYTSATDVPVTAAGYTASGNTVDFTLSYAPVTGTALTVVKNTSQNFISGTFGNLAQDQAMALTFAALPRCGCPWSQRHMVRGIYRQW